MLAAALPVTGGFGRGVGACALRLQNDCFVWLCAPVSAPRPRDRCARLAAACAALCSRGCCGWCAHSGGCTFLHTFHFIFLPAPLDTRLSLCYNHRRTDGVRLDRFHFITKRRDLSSPVFLFFLPCAWQDPPTTLIIGLVEGGRGVCLAVALCCVGRARAAPRSRLAFGAGRLRWCFCRRLSCNYTPSCQGSRQARAARP